MESCGTANLCQLCIRRKHSLKLSTNSEGIARSVVLHGFTRRDAMPFDAGLLTPVQDGHCCQFGAVVGHDRRWSAAPGDDRIQFMHQPDAREGGIRDEGKALVGIAIYGRADTESGDRP